MNRQTRWKNNKLNQVINTSSLHQVAKTKRTRVTSLNRKWSVMRDCLLKIALITLLRTQNKAKTQGQDHQMSLNWVIRHLQKADDLKIETIWFLRSRWSQQISIRIWLQRFISNNLVSQYLLLSLLQRASKCKNRSRSLIMEIQCQSVQSQTIT